MKRSTILFIVLGVVAVTAIWWVVIIGPRQTSISDAEDQLFSAEQQAGRLQTRIRQLNEIKDQEISYLLAIGEMESSIPNEPEFDTFLEDLTFLAERSGVDVVAIAATPPAEGGTEGTGLFEIEVSISIEGQFFEILGFLFGMEEMERLIRVDTIALNPVAIPEEETTTTTTTTTAAPDGATTSTSTSTSITTTTIAQRARPEPGLLEASLTTTLFTRTPVAAPSITVTTTTEAPADEGAEEGESE